jgi:predicted P-loop ATPase
MNARTDIVYGARPEDWDTLTLLAGLTADLLPVVSNPHAEISPDSKMKDLGKTPSRYNGNGQVVGIPGWSQHVSSDADIARWSRNSDLGICIQTRDVRALDVDVADQALAHTILGFIEERIDPGSNLPLRYRKNSGKCLLAFRLDGERRKRRMKVEGGIIEFLGDGQQFIAVGTHPSGVRYEWSGGLPDDFPVFSIEQFDALWSALAERFAIEPVETERPAREVAMPAAPVDRAQLVAALDAIPNSGAQELDYDDWLHVVMALHHEYAADEEGLALAHKFSSRASKYDPDEVDLEWSRIKGASHSGKVTTGGTVLAMARRCGWTEDVSDDFDVVEVKQASGKAEPPPLPPFIRNGNGDVLVTMHNMVMAIERPDVCGMQIGYDTFRDEIMYSEDDGRNWSPFKDADYSRVRIALERRGFKPPSKEITRDAVLLVAERQSFDSAQLWLSQQRHDGVARVEGFLSTYMGVPDSPYARAVSRYLWTALAGRVIEPGCKADMAPVLVGKQGARKSSAVAAMVPSSDFFAEISFGEKEDDLSRKMRGRLVAELAELKGLHSRESDHVKAWITKRYEDWTPKYREFNTKFPRRLVFIGTTNRQEFLSDDTGNRRWLPVQVGERIDVDGIARDCLQLWAEARDLFELVGVDYHDAENLATGVHADHMMKDVWEPFIRRWLNTEDDVTGEIPGTREFLRTHEVLEGALRMDAKSCKRVDEMRIGDVLRAIGYVRRQKRVNGEREYVYYRPEVGAVTTPALPVAT